MRKIFLKKFENIGGYSLVEVIIALGIFSILISAIFSLIIGGFSYYEYARNEQKASELSDEAITALRVISQNDWDSISGGRSAISYSSGRWVLAGSGTVEVIDNFTRTVDFYPVWRDAEQNIVASTSSGAEIDTMTKIAVVAIGWQAEKSSDNYYAKTVYLTSTNTNSWWQDDWRGGAEAELWDGSARFATSSNIDFSIAGNLQLASTTLVENGLVSGYLISTALRAPAGIFKDFSWEASSSCEGCAVKMQLQTSADDNGMPGVWYDFWCGPAGKLGNDSEYFLSGSSTPLLGLFEGDEWIRYKVTLIGDGSTTPHLLNMQINYR